MLSFSGLAGVILNTCALANQSEPVNSPRPDSDEVFVGYFHYHVALAAEVDRRREKGIDTGEVLLENVCNTIGIQRNSFWFLTPVIREALARLANRNGVGPQSSTVDALARAAKSHAVVSAAVQEMQRRLSPAEWDHLRTYLNTSFRLRIHSQVVRSK